MQLLGPKRSSLGTNYTAAAILALLLSPTRHETYMVDRLSKDGSIIGDITSSVTALTVTHDTTRDVHRDAAGAIRADAGLDWLNDLIRPRYVLPTPDGGYVDWSLGIFTLTHPKKSITPGATWREITAYDTTQLLVDSAFGDAFTVSAGTDINTAIRQVLAGSPVLTDAAGQPRLLIIGGGSALPSAIAWKPGDSRLSACNDLLAAIAYNQLWADEQGQLRSEQMADFAGTTAATAFAFDGATILDTVPIVEDWDTTKAFNQIRIVVSDPNRPPFVYQYENANPLSPISTVNWHPKLQVVSDSRIVDYATAQLYAQRVAQAAARFYVPVTATTIPWPVGQNLDPYTFSWSTDDEGIQSQPYVETKWIQVCSAGAGTQHELERIVPV